MRPAIAAIGTLISLLLLSACGDAPSANSTSASSSSTSSASATSSGGAEWSEKIDYLDPKTVVKQRPPFKGKMMDPMDAGVKILILLQDTSRDGEWKDWIMNETNYENMAPLFENGVESLEGSLNWSRDTHPCYYLMGTDAVKKDKLSQDHTLISLSIDCVKLKKNPHDQSYSGIPYKYIEYRFRRFLDRISDISEGFISNDYTTGTIVERYQDNPGVFKLLVLKGFLVSDLDIQNIKWWDDYKTQHGIKVDLNDQMKALFQELEEKGIIPNAKQSEFKPRERLDGK